jgi:exodeoxyribonuclease VII large subunit
VDITIADLVADLRAPTPSAAAEAVVQDRRTIQELLEGVRPRLGRALRHGVERRGRRIAQSRERMVRAMDALTAPGRRRLDRGSQRLEGGMRSLLGSIGGRLEAAAGKIDALSPLATLRRGYAVPLGAEDRVLRTTGEVRAAGRFDLRLADGRVSCEVEDREREAQA